VAIAAVQHYPVQPGADAAQRRTVGAGQRHQRLAGRRGRHGQVGQDPRHGDTIDPLWNLFDLTPEGRGTDWYPELSYS
jgi:predicted dithiol-disulfide oxidoreductase (DUF899 family)